ncbi:hypothetical protein BuS5_01716 [Desulfosarcina sp. BuS5]|nr:hypothetical protein [Desulfosarcina sp. BuS5]WDN88748.1 hypothetical protein BuS5_01716 [Desulfosarcina sp. BuS5]
MEGEIEELAEQEMELSARPCVMCVCSCFFWDFFMELHAGFCA